MSDKRITVRRDGEECVLEAPVGAGFLSLLKMHGFSLVCCNGKGTCGRCRILFEGGRAPLPVAADRIAFSAEELRQGYRLACMHRVQGDCVVQVEFVESRAVEVVTAHAGGIRDSSAGVVRDSGAVDGDMKDRGAGYLIAVDLGTTTVAMQAVAADSLRELRQGGKLRILGEYSCMNPQRRWGADVISRLQAAEGGAVGELAEAVRAVLEEGIERLCRELGRAPAGIWLAGNTSMEHLLMGLDTRTLGRYPFTPVCLQEMCLPGRRGKDVVCGQEIRLLPGISAFVGADITAGLLACGFAEGGGCRLFIDLGTNGEMAICRGDRLVCTATAAGPAFEGGAGANAPGTDMLALLAEMLEGGVIDETGLLQEPFFDTGWQKGELRITQQDIRGLQMAKAAVCAGVELLMEAVGTDASRVDSVFLAGGFGYFLDVEKAARIGLFPPQLAGKVTAVGNTSLLGACLYGGEESLREKAEAMCRRAEVLNLAELPGFEQKYLERINF
ncbi:ASKHA domain-containing protein [Eisenbergiella sp.]